jgi:DNA-binding NarL/FixJ family response regulator
MLKLSRRQSQLARMLFEGSSMSAISIELGVSQNTVYDIGRRLRDRLGATNSFQAGVLWERRQRERNEPSKD